MRSCGSQRVNLEPTIRKPLHACTLCNFPAISCPVLADQILYGQTCLVPAPPSVKPLSIPTSSWPGSSHISELYTVLFKSSLLKLWRLLISGFQLSIGEERISPWEFRRPSAMGDRGPGDVVVLVDVVVEVVTIVVRGRGGKWTCSFSWCS